MELPYLTEARLEKLGIPLGPRVRILQEAQSNFGNDKYNIYIVWFFFLFLLRIWPKIELELKQQRSSSTRVDDGWRHNELIVFGNRNTFVQTEFLTWREFYRRHLVYIVSDNFFSTQPGLTAVNYARCSLTSKYYVISSFEGICSLTKNAYFWSKIETIQTGKEFHLFYCARERTALAKYCIFNCTMKRDAQFFWTQHLLPSLVMFEREAKGLRGNDCWS